MRSVHVLRKPCSEPTVAANILRHGTGAVNVDACRVSFASESDEAESKVKNRHADFGTTTRNLVYGDYSMIPVVNYNPPGRWPANLVLQHLDGCRQDGVRVVKHADQSDLVERHLDEEKVAAWNCAYGCPAVGLDAQGGASRFFKQVKP